MNAELGLMQRFADPALFEALDTGDKVVASLITTLVGMGVTFTVLVLIWAAIAIMARIFHVQPPKKQAAAPASPAVTAPAAVPAADAPSQAAAGLSGETVAAILAAITASEGAGFMERFVVRKIDRTAGQRTAWNSAGSADCIDSRKF